MTEIEAIVEPDSVGNDVGGNLWRLYVFIPDKAGQALHRFYQFRVVKLAVPPPEAMLLANNGYTGKATGRKVSLRKCNNCCYIFCRRTSGYVIFFQRGIL
jgi:hypothetical protein